MANVAGKNEKAKKPFLESYVISLSRNVDCRAKFQNVATEFEDRREFVVNGEALLVEMYADLNYDLTCGGQFLHFIYLCERMLLQFTTKGGVICIVFFENMWTFWAEKPDLLLAREILYQHLKHNTQFRVLCVDNPWDSNWTKYLRDIGVTFIMTTDLADQGLIEKMHIAQLLFAIQHLFFLSQELNLAYLGGIQVSSNRLVANFIPGSMEFSSLVNNLPFNEKLKEYWKYYTSHNVQCDPEFRRRLDDILNMRPEFISKDVSLIVGAASCALFLEADKSETALDFVQIFLLHLVLKSMLPLKARSYDVNGEVWNETSFSHLNQIQLNLSRVLPVVMELVIGRCPEDIDHRFVTGSVADIMDGRLLTKLLVMAYRSPDMLNEASLGIEVTHEFNMLWSSFHGTTVQFPIVNPSTIGLLLDEDEVMKIKDQLTAVVPKRKPFKMIPISCPLMTEFVSEICEKLPKYEKKEYVISCGNNFDERYHWHSRKSLSDEFDRTKDNNSEIAQMLSDAETKRDRSKVLRLKQKYSSYMHWYAESLSSADKQIKIVVKKHSHEKKPSKKLSQEKKKVDLLREENTRRSEAKQNENDLEKWKNKKADISKLTDKQSYSYPLKEIAVFLNKATGKQSRKLAFLHQIQILWTIWMQECESLSAKPQQTSNEERNMSTAVNIMLAIQELFKHHLEISPKEADLLGKLTSKERKRIAVILSGLGFRQLAEMFHVETKPTSESEKYMIKMSSTRFQLLHMGHHLDRESRTDPDPRVPNFIPDKWQRELLDIVDHNQSALIVAPTSSGKTFTSYYCIERVLRESNDGVVVYVSPTKALVNQVAAVIYGMFKKDMPDGKALYGVFTRDYRVNALNSQVLITVPQCLEILILSPERQDWVNKIRYVIFDEVHSLGMEIGADVWEHLLMLIRCPFLALSATIQDPESLRDWLQRGENLRYEQDRQQGTLRNPRQTAYKVALVIYRERYADLESNIFLPHLEEGEQSEQNIHKGKFVPLHPLYSLTKDKIVSMTEFPEGLNLSAKETLQAYDAMTKAWPEKETIEELDIDAFFGCPLVIKRSKVREFERQIKAELLKWRDENIEKVEEVIKILSSDLAGEHEEFLMKMFTNSEDENSAKFLMKHCYSLAEKLASDDLLPALVFCFDRTANVKMASKAISHLMARENIFKEMPAVIELDLALEKRNNFRNEKRKYQEDKEKSHGKKDSLEQRFDERTATLDHDVEHAKLQSVKAIRKHLAHVHNKPESEISVSIDTSGLSLMLPYCSYVHKGAMSVEDVQKVRQRLHMYDENTPIVQGIKRGIGYHHSGCNNKLRSGVELLFRNRHMQLVNATGTLALGIHMPCRSVVFAGDSPFLNSLMFRQMSGRAGRRGYDQVGHIFFFGVPKRKIQHLLSADLSQINGTFPITASLVLRLFLFCNQGKKKDLALNMVLTLLKNPMMAYNKLLLYKQIQHFFIFCTQFLVKQGLLDDQGNLQGLAGLATHIHYHEPANFVFIDMLKAGCFHKLCQETNEDGTMTQQVMMALVTILAYLFTNNLMTERQCKMYRQKATSSKVLLPSLSESEIFRPFRLVIEQYNEKVISNFHNYMGIAADLIQAEHSEEHKLPLSGLSFAKAGESDSVILRQLAASSKEYKVCSAFAALSGHTDNDLWDSNSTIQNIRYGVYCEEDIMPVFRLHYYDKKGQKLLRNGYALDFFRHSSVKNLTQDNRIRSGDVFAKLKDFTLTIAAICTSLQEMGPQEDCVVKAFKQLNEEYSSRFQTTNW